VAVRRAGEWRIIRSIRRRFDRPFFSLRIGIGDDAALLRPAARRDLLVTTDMLVEGIDFRMTWCTFGQIGHKAMAANLSDIASMGGTPRYALAAVALPKKTAMESVDRLYTGMMRLARRHDVRLIGGDTSASPRGVAVTVVLIGEIETGRAIRRDGSRPGDRIFVTGPLGDARAGLEILKNGKRSLVRRQRTLIRKHLYPRPRIREGRLLSRRRLASAMIDVSDGLASDIRRLCEASGVGARIDLSAVPVSGALARYAETRKTDPRRYALQGGEDFELLFTVRPARLAEIRRLQESGTLRAYSIGEITPKSRGITVTGARGGARPMRAAGYEHFVSMK
jgi:thiamine-monophosphate kinase